MIMDINFLDRSIYRSISLIGIICFSLFGCSRSIEHFYYPDRSQCITVITENQFRYIIAGCFSSVPKSDFVKINLQKIDRQVADEIVGCWDRNNLEWVIMMNNVSIIENKLDKSKFAFKPDFPLDSVGISTLIDYDRNTFNCFSISFEYNKVLSLSGSISR